MIEQLKVLKLDRSYDFKSLDNFIEWADKVEPLLSISSKYEREFNQARTSAEVCFRMKQHTSAYNNMSEAVGVLNRAVTALELPKQKSEGVSLELKYPDKITWSWLKKHVEIKQWVYVASIAAAIFYAGISFGNSKLYHEYFKGTQIKTVVDKNV